MTTLEQSFASTRPRFSAEAGSLAIAGAYAATAALALAAPEVARLAWLALGGALLVFIAAIDFRSRIVPNAITYPAVPGALAVSAAFGGEVLALSFLGAAAGFVGFYALALLSRGAMGMGDVKLAAFVGALLGIAVLPYALALGMFLASTVAVALLVTRRASRKDAIPLAPFLVAPALLLLALGQGVVS